MFRGRHLESLWRDVTNGALDVIGNPFYKVGAVFVLDIEHLFVNFFGRHATTEHGCSGEVTSVTRIRGTHHVLGIKHLLSEFRNSQCTVLLGSTGGQWSKANHEKRKTREKHEIHSEFAKIGVQLTRKSKTASNTTHGSRHQVVQVTVCWSRKLERTEANVVECFVVNDHDFVGIFHQLVNGKSRVVWLHNG